MLKITAHVPCQQYGYFEIEGEPEDKAEIERLYNEYAEHPINFRSGDRRLLKAWVGGEVYYDEVKHQYTNEAGEVYLSGSVYASSFDTPFDTDAVSSKMADKSGVPAQDIAKMWQMKADISNGLGTAIHAAMELYGKFYKYVGKFDKAYHLHDHPVIKQAVEDFYANRHDEEAIYEALVVDHNKKWAGQIDRIVKDGDGYYIEDFKTNGELKPAKLKGYWRQLSFYAAIVEAGGKHIKGLRIHHWNGGEWTTHESQVLELEEAK